MHVVSTQKKCTPHAPREVPLAQAWIVPDIIYRTDHMRSMRSALPRAPGLRPARVREPVFLAEFSAFQAKFATLAQAIRPRFMDVPDGPSSAPAGQSDSRA